MQEFHRLSQYSDIQFQPVPLGGSNYCLLHPFHNVCAPELRKRRDKQCTWRNKGWRRRDGRILCRKLCRKMLTLKFVNAKKTFMERCLIWIFFRNTSTDSDVHNVRTLAPFEHKPFILEQRSNHFHNELFRHRNCHMLYFFYFLFSLRNMAKTIGQKQKKAWETDKPAKKSCIRATPTAYPNRVG